jgi:hypothetical protein
MIGEATRKADEGVDEDLWQPTGVDGSEMKQVRSVKSEPIVQLFDGRRRGPKEPARVDAWGRDVDLGARQPEEANNLGRRELTVSQDTRRLSCRGPNEAEG